MIVPTDGKKQATNAQIMSRTTLKATTWRAEGQMLLKKACITCKNEEKWIVKVPLNQQERNSEKYDRGVQRNTFLIVFLWFHRDA